MHLGSVASLSAHQNVLPSELRGGPVGFDTDAIRAQQAQREVRQRLRKLRRKDLGERAEIVL